MLPKHIDSKIDNKVSHRVSQSGQLCSWMYSISSEQAKRKYKGAKDWFCPTRTCSDMLKLTVFFLSLD